jgi:hypothetical protein
MCSLSAADAAKHSFLAPLEKEMTMIYTKDGLPKEKLIELLKFSMRPECKFLCAVEPAKSEGADRRLIQEESVIRFLKIGEVVCWESKPDGTGEKGYRFFVKILVEDSYWVENTERVLEMIKCGIVPPDIHREVNRILSE